MNYNVAGVGGIYDAGGVGVGELGVGSGCCVGVSCKSVEISLLCCFGIF